MRSIAQNRTAMIALLLASLMMRAGIPDGYMPAAAGSGMLYEMCPAVMPAELIETLGMNGHQHHHENSSKATSHYDANQCPIGHMLSAAVVLDNLWQLEATPISHIYVAASVLTALSRSYTARRARGPPA